MIGVFGGSGFTAFLDDVTEQTVDTPSARRRGPCTSAAWATTPSPSSPATAPGHRFPPHRVPYRANVWALRELGVTRIFGPVRRRVAPARRWRPATSSCCDQVVDRTAGPGRHLLRRAGRQPRVVRRPVLPGAATHRPGRGRGRGRHRPRRPARSWSCQGRASPPGPRAAPYRAAGWDVINMTQYPEAVPRPGAGPLLRGHRAGHRLRHRRRGRPVGRAGDPRRGVRVHGRQRGHAAPGADPGDRGGSGERTACGCAAAANGIEPVL